MTGGRLIFANRHCLFLPGLASLRASPLEHLPRKHPVPAIGSAISILQEGLAREESGGGGRSTAFLEVSSKERWRGRTARTAPAGTLRRGVSAHDCCLCTLDPARKDSATSCDPRLGDGPCCARILQPSYIFPGPFWHAAHSARLFRGLQAVVAIPRPPLPRLLVVTPALFTRPSNLPALQEPTSSWRSDWPRTLESRTMLGTEDGAGRGARSSERLPADGDGHLASFPSTPARRRESPPALGPPSVGSAPKTPFRDAHSEISAAPLPRFLSSRAAPALPSPRVDCRHLRGWRLGEKSRFRGSPGAAARSRGANRVPHRAFLARAFRRAAQHPPRFPHLSLHFPGLHPGESRQKTHWEN